MMKNLRTEFNDIYEDNMRWKYYSQQTIGINPFCLEPDSNENARRFIEKYFEAAHKDMTLLKMDRSNRQLHSASSFFLGILIKEKIFPNLLNNTPGFLYLWFLTCLYHDMGYVVELDKDEYPPEITCLESLTKKLKDMLPNDSSFYDLLKESESRSIYSILTIKNYYEYCRKSCVKTVNHGVVGGLVLYHRLNDNYKRFQTLARYEYEAKVVNFNPDDFMYDGLHYDSKHKEYYSIAASTIVDHNIWLANKDNVKEYNKYELKELKRRPLACKTKNQFLFLLALVDTIEPIKFFSQHNPACLLDNISIEVSGDEKSITLKVDDSCIVPEDWFNKIVDLKTWFNVKIEQNEKRRNMIKINLA